MNKLLNLKGVQSFCTSLSKIPLIMRITLVLLFVFAFNMNAEYSYSQSARISLDIKNSSVEKVLQTIEQKSDFYFLYSNRLIDVDRTVSVKVENEAISSILDNLFSSDDVEYEVKGTQIVLSPKEIAETATVAEQNVQQDGKTVTGRVVDAQGETIIGANIIEKGTSNGTITDFDGNFTLQVSDDAVLRISYIGYLEQEVSTVGRNTINVTLVEDTKTLDELVVVGYSTQRKESLTGALQTIKGENLKDVTSPSVENLLNGKVPGVYVSPGSGQPGSSGAIVIRGKSTINGSTDPLWVIDGVIIGSSPGALNPADIENMTILKDAASTAVYGSQGANGVILVTTKNPISGEVKIDFSAKAGVTSLNSGNLEVMNGAELYDYYSGYSNVEQIAFPRWNEDLRNSNYSWWDLASQTGIVQDYNITIRGGSENLRSLLSVGFYDEKGAVKGYDYTRYNFLYKTDFRPFEWLKVKPSISGSKREIDDKQYSVGAMYSNLPWDSPYDEEGNIVGHYSDKWVNSNSTNYIYDLQWNKSQSTTYEFVGNFDIEARITDYLTFASVNSYKYQNYNFNSYSDPRSSSAMGVNGRLDEQQTSFVRRYTNQLLRFNKLFDRKHSVNAVLGYEFNDYWQKNMQAIGTGFVPGFEVLDVTSVPEKVAGTVIEWAVQSMLFNANYAFDNRYLFQLSLRRDGASNFGDNAKYGNFFSVSGGWNIHNEAFFNADWVNNLKLRASYGSVGNRPSALYPQYDLYSISQSYNTRPGALISQIGNKDLTWEKSYTAGIGIDATLFDRVRLTLDYYEKKTDNLLYQVPVSGLTGVTAIWKNVGEVNNRGFEATAGVDVVKTKDLLWSINANIGLNRNEVSKLYGEEAQMIIGDGSGIAGSAQKLLKPGLDSDSWYLREWAGVNPANGAPQWYKTVKGANGEETRELTSNYAEANSVVIDAYTPDFFGGFSTDLFWKEFDLSAVFGFSVGGKIYNYSRQEYDADGAYSDRNQMKLISSWNRWEKEGDIATHPVAAYNNPSNSNKVSSRYLESGTYLKLRSVSLGYNVPLNDYFISNLRLFVTGENLLTFTKYSGVDPEIPPIDNKVSGVTTAVYPSTRKFLFGFNLTF